MACNNFITVKYLYNSYKQSFRNPTIKFHSIKDVHNYIKIYLTQIRNERFLTDLEIVNTKHQICCVLWIDLCQTTLKSRK